MQNPSPAALLSWYDKHRRTMPWRALPGEPPNPYRVWLSEIMLQQTNVTTVIPYFEKFQTLFPTIHHLANAPTDQVMAAWAGLGYYARARNLHACAKHVSAAGGQFPNTVQALQTLPGIGPYTARAIAAIAFGVPTVPVDGNVERVTARLYAITTPLPAAKPALAEAAQNFGNHPAAQARASDFAQSLFDLGATICTGRPACALCPLTQGCAARAQNIQETLPARTQRQPRPHRYGALFWLTNPAGEVLLRRRPPTGLLGGMTELPGTDWLAQPWPPNTAQNAAPMPAPWRHAGQVRHIFTHFELHLEVFAAQVPNIQAPGFLRPATQLHAEALPSVMRKGVTLARAVPA